MDVVQDWAAYFLNNPNQAAYAYTYSPYIYRAYNLLNTAKSWILPIIDQMSRKPDLATIALLLIIVLVSLKILDMLWQTILFWVKLGRRVLFWGSLALLAVWLWSRGPEGMVEDVQYWQSVWSNEYGNIKEREQVARFARQGANYVRRQQPGWF